MSEIDSKVQRAYRVPRGVLTSGLLGLSVLFYSGRSVAIQDQSEIVNPTYNSARQSLEWMTKSLMRVAEKLDEVSSTLDPNATEEQISRDVKQAMRDAFAEFSTWPGGPTEKVSSLGDGAARVAPQAAVLPKQEASGVGEVTSNDEILSVESGSKSTAEMTKRGEASLDRSLDNTPIWDANAPAWVRDRVIDQEYVRVAIESTVESSLEECRTALQQQAYEQVLDVLDKHVLQYTKARLIPELSEEFVMKELLKQETEYDLVLDRPSGTYHQLFQLLSIGPDAMYKMKRWDRESATRSRVQQAVTTTLGSIGLLALASGVTGWVSRRETSKKREI